MLDNYRQQHLLNCLKQAQTETEDAFLLSLAVDLQTAIVNQREYDIDWIADCILDFYETEPDVVIFLLDIVEYFFDLTMPETAEA